MAVRVTAFSLTLLLVPVLVLAWIRYVWQPAQALTFGELMRRTGLIIAAGCLAYLLLRLVGAAVSVALRRLELLDRRLHPWRW